MFRTHAPRYLRRLLEHTLTALRHPEAFNDAAYARTLMTAAHSGETTRGMVADRARDALGGTSVPRNAAGRVLQQVGLLAARVATRPDQTRPDIVALTAVKRDPGRALPPEPTADWDALQATLTGLAEPGTQKVLDLVAALLRRLAEDPLRPSPRWDEDVQVFLSEPYVAAVVAEALLHVADAQLLIARIRYVVMNTLWRQPPDPIQ